MDQEADAIEVASFEQEGAGLKVVSEYEEIDERPTETDLQPNLEGAEDESHQLATSLEDPSTMPSAKDESILETEQEGHIAIAASYMEGSELGTPSYVGESSPLLEKRARSGAFLEVADTREETKRTVEGDSDSLPNQNYTLDSDKIVLNSSTSQEPNLLTIPASAMAIKIDLCKSSSETEETRPDSSNYSNLKVTNIAVPNFDIDKIRSSIAQKETKRTLAEKVIPYSSSLTSPNDSLEQEVNVSTVVYPDLASALKQESDICGSSPDKNVEETYTGSSVYDDINFPNISFPKFDIANSSIDNSEISKCSVAQKEAKRTLEGKVLPNQGSLTNQSNSLNSETKDIINPPAQDHRVMSPDKLSGLVQEIETYETSSESDESTITNSSNHSDIEIPNTFQNFDVTNLCNHVSRISRRLRVVIPNVARIINRICKYNGDEADQWTQFTSLTYRLTVLNLSIPPALVRIHEYKNEEFVLENMKTRLRKLCQEVIDICEVINVNFKQFVENMSTQSTRAATIDLIITVKECCGDLDLILNSLRINMGQLTVSDEVQPSVEQPIFFQDDTHNVLVQEPIEKLETAPDNREIPIYDEAQHLKGSLEEQKTDSPVKTEEQMSEIELDRVTINMSDVGAESAKGISSSSKDKKSSPFQLQMDVSQTSVRCIVDRSIGSQDNISDKEVLETAEDVKSVDTAPVDVEETGAAIQEPNLYEENAYGEKLAEIPGEFAANTWSKASTLGPADVPDVYLPFALVPTDEISKICYNINLINTKIRTITPNIARIVSRINSFDTQTQTDWTDSSSVALKITMMTWDLPNALTQVKKNVKDPVMFENMKTRSIKICRDIIHECDIVTIQFRDVIQRVSSTPQDRPPVRDLRRQVNEFCNKINPILDDLNLNIEQLSATKAIQPIVEEQEVIPEVPANNEEVDNQEESPSKLKRFSQYFYAVGASILIVGVISGAIFLITRFQKRDDDKFHTL
ncbi:hypothetical protein C0J52_08518 [Blattella germanica]|nr:hypothetical protein C0J52_08518 [Blattella germanica]